jgi:hypothetical protein
MSEPKWTPAPWRSGTLGNFRIYGPDGAAEHSGVLAEVLHRTETSVRIANRSLIAAAPELYEALEAATHALEVAIWQGLRGAFEDDDELATAIAEHVVVKPARAALAKARGEAVPGSASTAPPKPTDPTVPNKQYCPYCKNDLHPHWDCVSKTWEKTW